MLTEQDWLIRSHIYHAFAASGKPPSYQDVAPVFGMDAEAARLTFHRLHDAHTIFLNPGTDDIRMANPLSATPTDYLVRVNGRSLWANCAWDFLGIPAMLHADATIEARHRMTGETIRYAVKGNVLEADGGLIHFPLPFSRWYDDLVDT